MKSQNLTSSSAALAPCCHLPFGFRLLGAGLRVEAHEAVLIERIQGVPGDLPIVAVGIREIAAVAAPEDILRGFDDAAAGAFGQGQDFGDLLLRAYVVREGDAAETAARRRKIRGDVGGEMGEREKRGTEPKG